MWRLTTPPPAVSKLRDCPPPCWHWMSSIFNIFFQSDGRKIASPCSFHLYFHNCPRGRASFHVLIGLLRLCSELPHHIFCPHFFFYSVFFLEILRHSLDININSLSISYVVHFCAKLSASCLDRIPQDATAGVNANSCSWVCKPTLPLEGGRGAGQPHGAQGTGHGARSLVSPAGGDSGL